MNNANLQSFNIRWADLDPNGHMRHTAYMDYAAQARVGFLAASGFGLEKFQALHIGPVLFHEETNYLHEVRANERISVGTEVSGLSPNRKHWRIRHLIFNQANELVCVVNVQGAWLDLVARKIVPPPAELLRMMEQAPRSEDYAEFTAHK